jgi:hypothetical protein
MRLPDETLDELDDEARAWQLLAPWDVHPGNARLERHAVYTFQARYAERWREGRVLLAGDAAHQMPPFAGQGMCAGLRDAANLAWKLGHVLDGHAGDGLLDTYQAERLPSAAQAIELSMELGKVICVPDPAEAARRDEAMAAAVTDELTRAPGQPGIHGGVTHPDSPAAGRLFGQFTAAERRFDDVYGTGWRLVSVDVHGHGGGPGAIDPEIAAWFTSIGGRTIALGDADAAEAATNDWWPSFDATWVLERPDFHVYGTAADAAGATDLLTHLRGRLAAPAPTLEGTSS